MAVELSVLLCHPEWPNITTRSEDEYLHVTDTQGTWMHAKVRSHFLPLSLTHAFLAVLLHMPCSCCMHLGHLSTSLHALVSDQSKRQSQTVGRLP